MLTASTIALLTIHDPVCRSRIESTYIRYIYGILLQLHLIVFLFSSDELRVCVQSLRGLVYVLQALLNLLRDVESSRLRVIFVGRRELYSQKLYSPTNHSSRRQGSSSDNDSILRQWCSSCGRSSMTTTA